MPQKIVFISVKKSRNRSTSLSTLRERSLITTNFNTISIEKFHRNLNRTKMWHCFLTEFRSALFLHTELLSTLYLRTVTAININCLMTSLTMMTIISIKSGVYICTIEKLAKKKQVSSLNVSHTTSVNNVVLYLSVEWNTILLRLDV